MGAGELAVEHDGVPAQQGRADRTGQGQAAVTRRLAIEASHPDYWRKYVGPQGRIIGMSGYGESGKAEDLFRHFGFTVENVVDTALALLD